MRDECFIRGKVPMTKNEVRAISISKLEIQPDSIIYDVGAGTGSVAVEMALQAKGGQVFAMDHKKEACDLIEQNKARFSCQNITIIHGKAPECMRELPRPDCVFVGGSSGNLEEILDLVFEKNKKVRVVVNTITIETQMQIMNYIKKTGYPSEMVCVQVSRATPLGRYHGMEAQNPVTIITIGEELF